MTPAEWDAWLETQRIAIPRASVRMKRPGLARRLMGRRWSRK